MHRLQGQSVSNKRPFAAMNSTYHVGVDDGAANHPHGTVFECCQVHPTTETLPTTLGWITELQIAASLMTWRSGASSAPSLLVNRTVCGDERKGSIHFTV